MLTIVVRFLTFNVISTHPAVYWGLALVWLILLVASLSSLRSLEIPFGFKFAWFSFILCIPIIGLAVYASRCLLKGNWSFFNPIFASSKTAKKVTIR